jgi:conjugative relaxase-like TrwC/TraI family protein
MPLGREYQSYPSVPERIAARVGRLAQRSARAACTKVARIEAEETKAGSRTGFACFDLTFSVPKSVSVVWGLADATTQSLIADAHHAAVTEVVDLLERHVAATRTGTGGVAQEDVVGIAATAYDHYDPRTHAPATRSCTRTWSCRTRVRTASDGVWRTLAS